MQRAQIQMPDELYQRAKRLAEQREVSFAELVRRGLEYILSVYPPSESAGSSWEPPAPMDLGWRGLSAEELKDEAQRSSFEHSLHDRH